MDHIRIGAKEAVKPDVARTRGALHEQETKATTCGRKEGWFNCRLLARTSKSIEWEITLLGPTAYTVNPVSDLSPRASPYRGGVFVATCTFSRRSYPFSPPTVQFRNPVFHPHIYSHGTVDPELMAVLWNGFRPSCGHSTPPVLLAHLLLELLAYPTCPEAVAARKLPAPIDEADSAGFVLLTEGVDAFETRVRAGIKKASGTAATHLCNNSDSDLDEDELMDVLAVSTVVQSLGLWRLILDGRVHDVHRLLDVGVAPDTACGIPARPLLAWAAISKAGVAHQIAIMQNLVDCGADVNIRDAWGRTPLLEACKCGHEEAVRFLLAADAEPEIRDMNSVSPFDVATGFGYHDIADLVRPEGMPARVRTRSMDSTQSEASEAGTGTPIEESVDLKAGVTPDPSLVDRMLLRAQEAYGGDAGAGSEEAAAAEVGTIGGGLGRDTAGWAHKDPEILGRALFMAGLAGDPTC